MPPADMNEHKSCLITGSSNLVPLKGYERAHLVKSLPLGFVFSSRIPTENELVECYQGYKREYEVSPITVKRHHELLDGFEKFRKTGRILDVGCGSGYFLVDAKKRGWDVYGTEYTDDAMTLCRSQGIQMQQGKLDPKNYEPESFDVITSFEVIEHINNPIEEIQNIKKILRLGGLFYVTTPNFNALSRYLFKSKYNIITYPEHLSYYTKKTLDYLLTHNGFKKHKLVATGLSLDRLQTSFQPSTEDAMPQVADEKLRQRFEKNLFMKLVKKLLNGSLNTSGLGSALKGWYVK